ncbi:hypothetical protein CEE45_16710 [Candidatus Heimdallarchaeota archaeon B3_Heim]|nr:MAG: hypothetical protein CEE45_16710 [Candidatus Heimdallarchaeota archaeon B3_Heim]
MITLDNLPGKNQEFSSHGTAGNSLYPVLLSSVVSPKLAPVGRQLLLPAPRYMQCCTKKE